MALAQKAVWCGFLICLLSGSSGGFENRRAVAHVVEDCAAIRAEFAEVPPRYFSGPDPWEQIDQMPTSFNDGAFAAVYSEGTRVRWVVLEMEAPEGAWYEATNYYFDAEGFTEARERVLESKRSNIRIAETTYYARGRHVKTIYRHSALAGRRENWDDFIDPHAPEYISTADLPVLFLNAILRRIG